MCEVLRVLALPEGSWVGRVSEGAYERRLVVVDLKTSARRYTDLQVEASLQLSIYSYATGLLGYADPDAMRASRPTFSI